ELVPNGGEKSDRPERRAAHRLGGASSFDRGPSACRTATLQLVSLRECPSAFAFFRVDAQAQRPTMMQRDGMSVSSARPARILVADDHELVRQGMRALFESEPQWVVCGEASTGRQALAMTLQDKPDLVVLDVALPEMNGIEVTRQIRRTLPVAILIVTMHDSDDILRDAIEAGANGVVLKAEAGRTLADAVRTVLSQGEFISERVGRVAGRGATNGDFPSV